MSIKPRYKRRIIWSLVSVIGFLLMAIIVVPPMIHLNSLKTKIQNVIFARTGIKATIHGNINFSLLGKTTIIAHDITIPDGFISSCKFSIRWIDMFNIKNAKISDDIVVDGASLSVKKITPFNMKNNIIVHDSKMRFLNKEYEIIDANFSKEHVQAIVRTDQHKYEIKSFDNNFTIQNKNNNLNIAGQLNQDGTATAHLSIIAQDVNRWFEFSQPRIRGHFLITTDVKWDGGYGIDFYNISANGVKGSAQLEPDGYKNIKLNSKTADYDMSFIVKNPEILKNTSFDMDFYGQIKFLDKTFQHLYINTSATDKKVNIHKIKADDVSMTGGYVDSEGAHNVFVSLHENKIPTKCVFNGTPDSWQCTSFSYGDILNGDLSVENNILNANLYSNKKIDDFTNIVNSAKRISSKSVINFQFADSAGTIKITGDSVDIKYDYAMNKTLKWANTGLNFLPDFMVSENGNFVWQNDTMIFTPNSKTWSLTTTQDSFYLTGDNFKKWLPNIDLISMKNLSYVLSGNYNKGNISDLKLEIANHIFNGSASKKSVTLKTNVLNIDSFISDDFIDNYEELSFFTAAPIMIPFDLDVRISLSADSLIYNGQTYNNFVYSLKTNSQTFSITDANRGNMLTIIKKKKNNYNIDIQLNKFVFNKNLLPSDMPLNISDCAITAEIKLKTTGIIAHDIFENINGTFDLSIDGGILDGLGLAQFYASAQDITTLNAEYALARALETGKTPIKTMRIIGTYDSGNIQTTKPFLLSLKHTDATGNLTISENKMFAKLKLILRGTSSDPAPIDLTIYPSNKREYYLSEIMLSFDPEYMRTFIQSHNQF